MQCKCGNEIDNVPEHLKDLATWICSKCTNTSQKSESAMGRAEDEDQLKAPTTGRPQKAA